LNIYEPEKRFVEKFDKNWFLADRMSVTMSRSFETMSMTRDLMQPLVRVWRGLKKE
jgi:hypothetical protein